MVDGQHTPQNTPVPGQPGQGGQPNINISISEDMKAGTYANAASASVTANELILDFGYIVPNETPMTVKVVSRVNMSIKTAESLVQLLQGSIGDYYQKVQKQGGQQPPVQGQQPAVGQQPSQPGPPPSIPTEGPTL